MNFNESFFLKNRLEETEMFIETYETLLSGARKDMENIREELILLDEFESRFDKKILPKKANKNSLKQCDMFELNLFKHKKVLKNFTNNEKKSKNSFSKILLSIKKHLAVLFYFLRITSRTATIIASRST